MQTLLIESGIKNIINFVLKFRSSRNGDEVLIYKMEEMLPIVAKLADKYTSKECSSVSYDTARKLMEAVAYSINEFQKYNDNGLFLENDKIECEIAYEKGCDYILSKTKKAKEVYDGIIKDFKDYGCKNYRDTIIKGMPEFFIRYDPKFSPHKHILTLDYPVMNIDYSKRGIDLIYDYLKAVEIEKDFLELFSSDTIIRILERVNIEYEELYLDNICYTILLYAVGLFIADKTIMESDFTNEDIIAIENYFKGDSVEKIETKIKGIIKIIIKGRMDGEKQNYFNNTSREYAIRISNGINTNSLRNIF